MNTSHLLQNAQKAAQAFLPDSSISQIERIGNGHINFTFLVTTPERRYLLQKINSDIFPNVRGLIQNITLVCAHLRNQVLARGEDPDRLTMTLLPTATGDYLYQTADNHFWRMYLYIENTVSLSQSQTPQQFYQSARAFGQFQRDLNDFDAAQLIEILPHFHDTRARYQQLLDAISKNTAGRLDKVAPELDFVMQRKEQFGILMDALESGLLPLRVTHNDTKLNNVLLDENTFEPICVIDLDTVMPGLALNDFGDSIRFGASTAAEDEMDLSKVHFSMEYYEAYVRGFLESCGSLLTPKERELLPLGAWMMTMECGMRFLADHLNGDTYFQISRPGQNLDRARTQFRLAQEMESNRKAMHEIVQRYSR
ncbi:MAG: aminoglycoside phosphotransferase family protein [Peptoniphilaceae bacterium]|nr:aminoglycoside phosphotransferase family protein [Peptoniphilaceae bacterium]MDY3075239.1 aminoglycoside phosphotransferase family protein [Peptoniphilaceae bacterium]